MQLINTYVHPQDIAKRAYQHFRGQFNQHFTNMQISSSSYSYNKQGVAKTCTQICTVELERLEPYQACTFRMDVDMAGDQANIQIIGSGVHDLYVFPSDADALELWLIQFKTHLRKEFSKDNNND
ncbi:hypothetical protein UFOVP657_14 [uncultured Caudovirales phage]|uniref:Uncharacterized protein n=1 Tax=uncultured Caudovirales phage TaxID=2100421 RepID=A0A6J5MIF9_9CAUD|nr:hypothetical protein UFOVP467_20 [uncultured Caudovirales phage]CAB4155679.1 hypothetical protein UFOVP657_14 [uncultured Caudovirales phage]